MQHLYPPLGFLFALTLLCLFASCGSSDDNTPDCPSWSEDIISPYADPAVSGQLIVFNYYPISSIDYTFGIECPEQADYEYDVENSGFYLLDRISGESIRISQRLVSTPSWSQQGDLLSFAIQGSIVVLPYPFGDPSGELTISGPRPYYQPSINPSGELIAYYSGVGDSTGTWITNLQTRESSFFSENGGYQWLNDTVLLVGKRDGLYFEDTARTMSEKICSFENPAQRFNVKLTPNKEKIALIFSDVSKGITEYKIAICRIDNDCACTELPYNNVQAFDFSSDSTIIYSEGIWHGKTLTDTTGVLWEVSIKAPFQRLQLTAHDNL